MHYLVHRNHTIVIVAAIQGLWGKVKEFQGPQERLILTQQTVNKLIKNS